MDRSAPRATARVVLAALALAAGIAAAGADQGPATGAEAPSREAFTVAPAASPITVDGVLDEPAWATATVVPIPYEWFPGDNTPAPVVTECLVTFDGDKLYVGFRAHDPEPGRVRAHLADRDIPLNDDLIGIQIDTFNDRRRAYQFQVNPLGVQLDALVSDVDATVDYSWDAIWDSAGRLTADGYEVELAIPFRQLRFPRAGGAQTWGFLATREYPRSEGHQLRSTPHDRNLDCQVCQFQTVTGFQDFDIGHNLEVVPTLTGSRTDQRATLDAPLESGGEDVEAGLNLRWSATPNVALNVAVNPDFSQVEADAAQLNVNERFALFFPEKRPFFLEGADLFSTPLDAVFTRSVADPSFGLKLSGKQGKSAFGVFAAEDRINNLIFPSFETSSLGSVDQDVRSAVVRYRRDLGATSTLGVLYAGRESDDYHNHVYGLDGTLRPTDSDTVRFQVLGSNTLYPDAVAVANDQPVGGFDGTAWQVNYTHNSRHWFWQAFREELDPEFRADSGFITRVGANNTILNFDRIFWGGADSPYSQIKFGCAYQILETTDGRNLEHSGNVVTVYQGRWKQFRVAFGLRPNRESFADVRFDDMRADMRISIRPSGSLLRRAVPPRRRRHRRRQHPADPLQAVPAAGRVQARPAAGRRGPGPVPDLQFPRRGVPARQPRPDHAALPPQRPHLLPRHLPVPHRRPRPRPLQPRHQPQRPRERVLHPAPLLLQDQPADGPPRRLFRRRPGQRPGPRPDAEKPHLLPQGRLRVPVLSGKLPGLDRDSSAAPAAAIDCRRGVRGGRRRRRRPAAPRDAGR